MKNYVLKCYGQIYGACEVASGLSKYWPGRRNKETRRRKERRRLEI